MTGSSIWRPTKYDWVNGKEGWELEALGGSPRQRVSVSSAKSPVMQNLYDLNMLRGKALKQAKVQFG